MGSIEVIPEQIATMHKNSILLKTEASSIASSVFGCFGYFLCGAEWKDAPECPKITRWQFGTPIALVVDVRSVRCRHRPVPEYRKPDAESAVRMFGIRGRSCTARGAPPSGPAPH